MSYILIISISLYISIFGYLLLNYDRKTKEKKDKSELNLISVLIPFRNEAKRINTILNSIKNHRTDKNIIIEYIFIDDHSSDDSVEIISKTLGNFDNFKILKLSDTWGKKAALEEGIKIAKGEIIIHTDADIEFSESWIYTHWEAHKDKTLKLLCGGVSSFGESSLFSRMQIIELNSLLTSSYICLKAGKPTMCNGANLSYKADIKQVVIDSFKEIKSASGDDIFLLFKIKKIFEAKSIDFLTDEKSVVSTPVHEKLSELFGQRHRWIKKSSEYKSIFVLLFSFSVLMGNLALFLSWIYLFMSNFSLWSIALALLIFILKFSVDYMLWQKSKTKFNLRYKKIKIADLIVLEFLYPIFTICLAFYSIFATNMWKGRRI
ncbi:MAG: glycosyltransferase [Bacteroidales bacterium]